MTCKKILKARKLCAKLQSTWQASAAVNLFILVAINFCVLQMECQFAAFNFHVSLAGLIMEVLNFCGD